MTARDPEGQRLPIKLDSTTNGEFAPRPLSDVHHRALALAHRATDHHARRLGLDRRRFLVSACGAATCLLSFNAAFAAAGRAGGFYALAQESAEDRQLAEATLGGDEFIFDVQGHFVNPEGAWLKNPPSTAKPLAGMPKAGCALGEGPGAFSYLDCLGPEEFIKDVFLDSDTDVMVLSFVPSRRDQEPLTIEEAAATAKIVEQLDGTHRLLLHGRVNPNQAGDLDGMDELAETYGVSAWKTYTQWGPNGKGFAFTDDIGLAFVEKARKLGVKNIAVHKGIPFGKRSYRHSLCTDIGPIARQYPDVNFLVYHSGFIPGQAEGPYDPERGEGVDALVRSVVDSGLGRGSNVFAELGSTWRYLMRDPDSAAHTLGKLIRHLGPDNVLWGTDSIWYGSPQDQIQAFRAFQISQDWQERYGYPAMTPALRRKILGLNALRPYPLAPELLQQIRGGDALARQRLDYRQAPDPSFLTHGPKTRREFLNFRRWDQI